MSGQTSIMLWWKELVATHFSQVMISFRPSLYFHLSSMPHTYSFSDCHRAHTGKDRQSNCMSGLTWAWAQTPFCRALQQTETFKTAEQKCCIVLQTRGNSTTDMHWTYKTGFQCEWFVVCFKNWLLWGNWTCAWSWQHMRELVGEMSNEDRI